MLIIWHPDKHHESERRRKLAEEKTKEINEAYEIAYKYACRRDQQKSRYQKEQKKQTTNTKETTASKRKSKSYKRGQKKQTTNAEANELSWIDVAISLAIIWAIIIVIVWAIR